MKAALPFIFHAREMNGMAYEYMQLTHSGATLVPICPEISVLGYCANQNNG